MKIDTPILRRLGPVPFWRGESRCLDELERIYRKAMADASDPPQAPNARTPAARNRDVPFLV